MNEGCEVEAKIGAITRTWGMSIRPNRSRRREYWLIDVTNLNNSWRLIQEIKDSNCNIEKKFIEKVKER